MEHAEALVAASWWTDQMMSRPDQHNGSAVQSHFLNELAASQPELKDGDYAMFSAVLRREINSEIDHLEADGRWKDGGVVILSTDYGPTGLLRRAVDSAGIKGLRLPVKSMMAVRPGQVEASRGYGSEMRTVWEASHG